MLFNEGWLTEGLIRLAAPLPLSVGKSAWWKRVWRKGKIQFRVCSFGKHDVPCEMHSRPSWAGPRAGVLVGSCPLDPLFKVRNHYCERPQEGKELKHNCISLCSLIPRTLLGQTPHAAQLPRQLLPWAPTASLCPQVHPDIVASCWQCKKFLRMTPTPIFQTLITCLFLRKSLLSASHHLNQKSSLPVTSLVPLSQLRSAAKFGSYSSSLTTHEASGSAPNSGPSLQVRMEVTREKAERSWAVHPSS